ncbi:MAG: primosomal protein N' [Deltaproteobacteria bacterium]|nr:primosomal protein N' [Deltaproteobacteria bacterium]
MSKRMHLRVAVSLPVTGTYTYALPEHLKAGALVGCRVMVPFGKRRIAGFILEQTPASPQEGVKEIADLLDDEPLFTEKMVPFFEWMARHYVHPVGQVIQAALPAGLNANPLKTTVLTDKGIEAANDRHVALEERRLLEWIAKHPGRRPSAPYAQLVRLRNKGWIDIREKDRPAAVGPLMRKFVGPAPGQALQPLLDGKMGALKAKNEAAFLETIFHAESTLLSDITACFSNGGYLVKKWVGRGVLECGSGAVYRNPTGGFISPPPVPEGLFEQQEHALKAIRGALNKNAFSTSLLFGVTGSGKTEVYYRAVKHALSQDRQALLMVPEISLAIYIEGLFRNRLGDQVAVYHSGLGRGERYDQWMRMVRGEVNLVIGARSALFAPLPRLGLIIVDEEHDSAYKQDMSPRYQARDLAVVRGRTEGATVVLGSGTPSVQSYHNAVLNRYHLLSMPERIERRPLPDIQVVDMKPPEDKRGEQTILSPLLLEAMGENLTQGDQTILFLNRRGFHRLFICPSCGESVRCPNCEVALTHHLKADRLTCHYCGYSSRTRVACPSCKGATLKTYGFGTEKLEQALNEQFPEARIARMDTDSTRRKGQAARILKQFADRETDILVGTQMITKGYDFPGVTLVGVVAADLSLTFPDFRAGERTFQLLSQVAGRSGRGSRGGRVIVQSFNSDHYAIRMAVGHDYKGFFEKEQDLREQLGYPPFSHLACLRLKGSDKGRTEKAAHGMGESLRRILDGWPKRGREIHVLGPIEAPLPKLKGKYRQQLLLKSGNASLMRHLLERVVERSRRQFRSEGVHLVVDVDPYDMS